MADSQTLYDASIDPLLNQRTTAIAVQEAYNNPAASDTDFGARVRADPYGTPTLAFAWPVAIQVQDAYASGVASGGNGADNVADGDILAAVQANWPPDA